MHNTIYQQRSISTLIKKNLLIYGFLFSAASLIGSSLLNVPNGLSTIGFTFNDNIVKAKYKDAEQEVEYCFNLNNLTKLTRELNAYAENQEMYTTWELNHKFDILAREIFEIVLGPVKLELKEKIELKVAGELLSIPWYGLVKSKVGKTRYLIDDHEISLNSKRIRTGNPSFATRKLQFIQPVYKNVSKLNSKKEVENFRKNGLKIKKVSSIRDQTKSKLNEYGITHYSGHTYESEVNSEIGFLFEKDTVGVSWISVKEEMAPITFLNGCSTAKSPEEKDFRYSLCGSFLAAGSKTCIGTLWKIEDQVASEISEQFYNSLSKGNSTTISLRKAMLYMKDKESPGVTEHNFSWAAYQAFGEEQYLAGTLEYKIKSILSLITSLLTSFSILSYYFGRRLKKIAIENSWV